MADVVIKRRKSKGKPIVVEFVDPALEDRQLRERKKVHCSRLFCLSCVPKYHNVARAEKTQKEKRSRGRDVRA